MNAHLFVPPEAPAIPIRSNAQFERELEQRMQRIAHRDAKPSNVVQFERCACAFCLEFQQ